MNIEEIRKQIEEMKEQNRALQIENVGLEQSIIVNEKMEERARIQYNDLKAVLTNQEKDLVDELQLKLDEKITLHAKSQKAIKKTTRKLFLENEKLQQEISSLEGNIAHTIKLQKIASVPSNGSIRSQRPKTNFSGK